MNLAATAALLAIMLVSMLVALRVGPLAPRDRVNPPIVLAPGITDEKLLLQARFDTFPEGVLSATVSRWVLQPGAEMPMGRKESSGKAPSAYRCRGRDAYRSAGWSRHRDSGRLNNADYRSGGDLDHLVAW